MRILDEDGNEILNPDYNLGYTDEETIIIAHHEAQDYVPDVYHYETIAEYYNGRNHVIGADVIKVIDIPGHPASEAWDETETILRWHKFTEEEKEILTPDEALRIIFGNDV